MVRRQASWALRLALAAGLAAPLAAAHVVARAQEARPAAAAEPEKHSVPQPEYVLRSWQVELEYQPPMRLVVKLPGETEPKHYLYILYTIWNPGPAEVSLLPRIQLRDEKLNLCDAQIGPSPALFERIKKLHGARFLEDPIQITGKLLTGKDNARDGIAIFALDHDPAEFKVYFGGLSGELQKFRVPKLSGEGEEVIVMDKERVLSFQVRGHAADSDQPGIVQTGDEWIMREAPPRPDVTVDLKAAAAGRTDEAVKLGGQPIGIKSTQPEKPKPYQSALDEEAAHGGGQAPPPAPQPGVAPAPAPQPPATQPDGEAQVEYEK